MIETQTNTQPTTVPEYVADTAVQAQEVAGSVDVAEDKMLVSGVASYAHRRGGLPAERFGSDYNTQRDDRVTSSVDTLPYEPGSVDAPQPLIVEEVGHQPLPHPVAVPPRSDLHA